MALPEPPVPPDVDLRNFKFMPLEVARLRDSELASVASGEEFKAAVMLWCAAWHQIPAGSVPNDDRWLAHHSGAGNNWAKVKNEALRGFTECSDGRLYHDVVVEKVRESWEMKRAQRERTKSATQARWERNGQRNGQENIRNGYRNGENFVRNVHQGIGPDKTKDFNTCSYLNCQATGTRSRSTTGGPWYCSPHFEAVFHGIEAAPEPASKGNGKFSD